MNWTIKNDYQSVTVGINHRIGLCKKAGLKPCLIRLGKTHSLLFWKERGVDYIPNRQVKLVSGDVFHNGTCWTYSNARIPMKFNDPKIAGIVVEGR